LRCVLCRSAAAEATVAEIAGNVLLLLMLPMLLLVADVESTGPPVLLCAIIEDAI